MKIGEVAELCGMTARTVRFYERRGLIPEPERTPAGYRDYDRWAVGRLAFIRAAQSAGLTLREIKQITELVDAGSLPCEHVSELLRAKLAEVRERRRQLDLVELIRNSAELDPAECRPENVCQIIASVGGS